MYKNHRQPYFGAPNISPTNSLMATLTNAGMRRRLGMETCPTVALNLKHIMSFNQQFRAQQVTGDPDSVAAWKYASAICAELFAWCGWNRADEFFNFKLEMFLFAYQNMGNTLPTPRSGCYFSAPRARNKVFTRQTSGHYSFFSLRFR
jgi:hypothetical protein